MAGHNKWSKVKHIKGAVDAKRAKIFSKLSREIFVSVKEGASDDPDLNPRLRMVLLKARQANMPSDNVQRAIQKATGEGGASQFLDLTYEIYGPQGVAIMAEISTDNKTARLPRFVIFSLKTEAQSPLRVRCLVSFIVRGKS